MSNLSVEKIPCPKCGAMMDANARYCIRCGTINPNQETNQVVKKAIQQSVENYHSGEIPLIRDSRNSQTAVADNTGNKKFAFLVTYLLYVGMILITGIATYLTGITSFDLLIISSYPLTVIFLSVVFLYIYSIELIFMKCNKPWWAGLVPIYNLMVLGDISFHNKYIGLLSLVPVVGQVFLLVMLYNLGKKFKYNGVLTVLLSIIYVPIIGFSDHLYEGKTYVTSGDAKSLEKDYRRKKVFFSTLILFLLIGTVLFIMGNMGKVRKTQKTINASYYVIASNQALKQVKKAVENNTLVCDETNYDANKGVYYVYYPDLGDSVFLPLYVARDVISAYVKIDNNKNPREYYVSMTDGKQGFAETIESEISMDTVSDYTTLVEPPKGNTCRVGQ